ncbi:hypothetical protein [Methylobacter sp. S3L5C]|uniref:hypothetical protein n=1 Tax=Methylobacter sp. S3L5C TaxID=2839024 RepID=UPI001FAD05EB|nr:hypothetical protein [Methylobacter sp. S3L5C]UOA07615.1 hypothetical protein KKZ03_15285 [Methylobacter sp. S3L5C]
MQGLQALINVNNDYTAAQKNLAAAIANSIKDSTAVLDASLATLNRAITAEKKVLSDKYASDGALLKTQLDTTLAYHATLQKAAGDTLSSATAMADALKSAIGSTTIESDATLRQQRSNAQATLSSALNTSRSGGSLALTPAITSALANIAKPSEQLFSDFATYALEQAKAGNIISELSSRTTAQVSVAQATVDAITAMSTSAQTQYDLSNQILTDSFTASNAGLDFLLKVGTSQVEVLKGIDNSVIAVSAVIVNVVVASTVKSYSGLFSK